MPCNPSGGVNTSQNPLLDHVTLSFRAVVPNFQNASIRSPIDGEDSLHEDEARTSWYNCTIVNKVLEAKQNREEHAIQRIEKKKE